ncbi:MAG: hypothetical protein KF884_10680 [Fimbriimonadaceae bacterium]|nr:hypothetical protein [Fimbriimonadaceae bacterium]QYK58011.1 MAG: hypothetical protein KF884_10680 [Fimbriimonadaceae bacterium]
MRLAGSALGQLRRALARSLSPGCQLRRKSRSPVAFGEAEAETVVGSFRTRFSPVRAGEAVREERLVVGRAWRLVVEASVDVRHGDVVVRIADGARFEVVAVEEDMLGQAVSKSVVVAREGF